MVDTWLWIGTFGMAIGSLGFLVYSLQRRHRDSREEQQGFLTFAVPLIAAIAYLAMALGQGSVMLGGQEVLWARYADWSLTTPLLLMHFVVMLRIRPIMAVGLIFADVMMIVTGFAGAVADHDPNVNYLWWVVSTGAFLAVIAILFTQLREYARDGEPRRAGVARNLMLLLLVLWVIYPIVWLFGQTGNAALSPGAEAGIYTIVDLVAKVGFGIAVTLGVASLPHPARSTEQTVQPRGRQPQPQPRSARS